MNLKGLYQGRKQTSSYPLVLISQVITPQVTFSQTTLKLYPRFPNAYPENNPITQVLEPIFIPRAFNTGTCINCNVEQGDLFYSTGPHTNRRGPGERSEKTENCLENLRNEIQLKGP